MRRLIYISQSRIGSDLEGLGQIVEQSSVRNLEAGITGMLWSDTVHFVQVLEGERDAIGATMNRIRCDPRHSDIDVVADRKVTTRMFGNWGMRRADSEASDADSTAFLVGYAARESPRTARHLIDIISASEG